MQKNASHFWVKLSLGVVFCLSLAACSSFSGPKGEFHNTIEDYPEASNSSNLQVPAGTPPLKYTQSYPIPPLKNTDQTAVDLSPPGMMELGIPKMHHWYDF